MRRLIRLPYLLIIAGPLVLFSPVYLTGRALFWGTPGLQFVPWWDLAWRALQAGELPLWNSQVGLGAPLLANYQTALLYPPTWIYFGLASAGGIGALAWGQALMVAAHLILAGWGMARLARHLGLNPLAQTVAGLAYGLSGYLVARAGFLSINAAAAWLPWILDAARQVSMPHPPRRAVLGLGLWLGLQWLAGHAQTAAYSLLLALAWSLFWALQPRQVDSGSLSADRPIQGPRGALWYVRLAAGRFTASAALAMSLAAGQLIPTGEYLLQSQRASEVAYETAMTYSFWPWRLAGFLTPDLFGNPVWGDYWGYANYWEDAVYIGFLPFLLAIGMISRLWRRRRIGSSMETSAILRQHTSLSWFLLGVILVSFLLALGQNTPVFPWLYRNIPGFDMFQAPTRIMLLAEVALALLAALGVHYWLRPDGRARYWTRLATAGAAAVTLGAGLAWLALGDLRPTFVRATALAGFWGVGVGLLSLTAPSGGKGRSITRWSWVAGLFVMADLLVAGWGLNPGVSLDFYRHPSPTASEVSARLAGGRLHLDADEEYDLKFDRFLRFDTFDPGEDWHSLRAVLLPNLHLLDGISHTANFDPLVPGRYARWMESLENAGPGLKEDLLNLMAVRLVERTDPRAPFGVTFLSLDGSSRARWFPCSVVAGSPEEAWDLVMAGRIDLDTTLIVEGADPGALQPCEEASLAQIAILTEGRQKITMTLRSETPGWLFLADAWYPGWQAWVDGQPVAVHPANYVFRAVQVPPGDHTIEFAYRPGWFSLALGITAAAWVGLGLGYALTRE